MSLPRHLSFRGFMKRKNTTSKRNCKKCQILSILKSGKAVKSPPEEKMKTHRFHERWFTLGIMDICTTCHPPAGKRSLMLSYYEDNSENNLKGTFEVDKSDLIPTDVIPNGTPAEYSNYKYVLKWELSYHARTLYMLVENETEQIAWIRSFEALLTMLKPPEDDVNDVNDNNDTIFNITDSSDAKLSDELYPREIIDIKMCQDASRLQKELIQLRNCQHDNELKGYPSDAYQEERFTSNHSFTATGKSPHDSGFSENSERFSGPSYVNSRSSRGDSWRDSAMSSTSENSWRSSYDHHAHLRASVLSGYSKSVPSLIGVGRNNSITEEPEEI